MPMFMYQKLTHITIARGVTARTLLKFQGDGLYQHHINQHPLCHRGWRSEQGEGMTSECAITESQSFRFHFEVDSEIRHASGDSYDSRSNINEWR